ncbi:MAG: glutamate 5-kinase [Promethearchaeota archaeon]
MSSTSGDGGALGGAGERAQNWNVVVSANRVVVKIGTSSLVTLGNKFDLAVMKRLAYDLEALKKAGKEVLLVTSGAVVAGVDALGLEKRPRDVVELQVLAAVGNPRLMEVYGRFFTEYPLAQILLTQENLSNRVSFNHFRQAVEKMVEMDVIPVINENDVVSIDELTHPEGVEFNFSDNDVLAALVAASTRADLLVILSDTEGLYTKHPNSKFAEFVPFVREVTPDVKKMGRGGGKLGRGGMASKVYAAEIATRAGCATLICNARPTSVAGLLHGDQRGTLFLPRGGLPDKKLWILFASSPKGRIQLDAGAKEAVEHGASLLVKGVTAVRGEFAKGDVVTLAGPGGEPFANGIVNYSSREIARVVGVPTHVQDEFIKILDLKEVVSHFQMTFL